MCANAIVAGTFDDRGKRQLQSIVINTGNAPRNSWRVSFPTASGSRSTHAGMRADRPPPGDAAAPAQTRITDSMKSPAKAHIDAWWRGGVIYQIYPRSFADANGDGVGDLAGITSRLDHVAALGVDAVWLSPFYKSPMKDFGYDVSDYRDVDPSFGSLADFKALLVRAHELGLKVMIDQVPSHSSDQHEWFRASRANRTNPRADWYVWA